MNDLKSTYLYDLPEEGQKMVDSGETDFGSGGLRNPDGSQAKQVKPSPLSIDDILSALELKISDDKDNERKRIGEALVKIEDDKSEQILEIDRHFVSAVREASVIMQQGFEITFSKLDRLSEQIQELDAEAQSKHYEGYLSQAKNYLEWLEGAINDRIPMPGFDSINSDVISQLRLISSFINDLKDEAEQKIESYGFCSFLIMQLMGPFTDAVILFSMRYKKDTGKLPRSLEKWLETIKRVSSSRMICSGYEYYQRLHSDLSYSMKMIDLGYVRKKLAAINEYAELMSTAIKDPLIAGKDPRLEKYIREVTNAVAPSSQLSFQEDK